MARLRSVYRAEIVAAGLVLVSVILMVLPESQQRYVTDRANQILVWPLSEVRGRVRDYLGVRAENRRLREELQRSRLELQAVEAVRLENRDLKGLLGFAEDQPVRLMAARVVGRNFDTRPTMFLVDVGQADGVGENLPVVTAEGVVGKTVAVSSGASRVMLYTHPDFSASALLLGGDHLEFGVIRSDRDASLELYLPLRSASAPGNRIVTSGYGGTFPRGIPIGEVVEVREDRRLGLQKIDRVRPVVDLESITAVFVLVREVGEVESAGDVVRLFWPGYAYPPMAGETLGQPDTIPVAGEGER